MPYRWRVCGRRHSVHIGCVMADTELGYRIRAIAMSLLTTGLEGASTMKLHRALGISRKSPWHLAHHVRSRWERYEDPFADPVEVDETYVDGKERNKHESKMARAGPTSSAPMRRRPTPAWKSTCTKPSSTPAAITCAGNRIRTASSRSGPCSSAAPTEPITG